MRNTIKTHEHFIKQLATWHCKIRKKN